MEHEQYEKEREALTKIANIASEAGLILSWEAQHHGTEFHYFDGDWEEGDINIDSVDRIIITRTVDEEGTPLFDDSDE